MSPVRFSPFPALHLAAALIVAGSTASFAQTSSGPSGGGAPASSGPASSSPVTSAPPPPPSAAPATPSQRNLDTRPPTTSLPPKDATTETPPAAQNPAGRTVRPEGSLVNRPGQTEAPPSASKRPTPGGAGSSEQSRRTGKNPLNETYDSCLRMWDRATHMSRQEWARACRRVANRLNNLQVNNDDLLGLRTGSAAAHRRRE